MKKEEVLLILDKLRENNIDDRKKINYLLFLDNDIKSILLDNINNSNFNMLINIIFEFKNFNLKEILNLYLNSEYDLDNILFG